VCSLAAAAAQTACAQLAAFRPRTVECTRYQSHDETIRRGESVLFEYTFETNDVAINLSAANTVILQYTPADPATNTTHSVVTGYVYSASAGKVRILWTSANEGVDDYYSYEVAVSGSTTTLVRAWGMLTLDAGVGDSSVATRPATLTTLDFDTVDIRNAGSAPFLSSYDTARMEQYTNEAHTAYGWGDHSTNGYVTGTVVRSESDPIWVAVSNTVTSNAVLGAAAHAWGDHGAASYATGTPVYTESDPIWGAVSNSVTTNASLGSTAHGWGDHAEAGYLTTGTNVYEQITVANTNSLGSELTMNGTFTGSANGWHLTSAVYSDNRLHCPFGATSIVTPSNYLAIASGRVYFVEFDLTTSDSSETVTLTMGGETYVWNPGASRTVSQTVHAYNTNNLMLYVYAALDSVYMDNVTVKLVTDGDARIANDLYVRNEIYRDGVPLATSLDNRLPLASGGSCSSGQVATAMDATGTNWQWTSAGAGDYMANGSVAWTSNHQANGHFLSSDGDSEGLWISPTGHVSIGSDEVPSEIEPGSLWGYAPALTVNAVGGVLPCSLAIRNTNSNGALELLLWDDDDDDYWAFVGYTTTQEYLAIQSSTNSYNFDDLVRWYRDGTLDGQGNTISNFVMHGAFSTNTPADGQVTKYNATSGNWYAADDDSAAGGSPVDSRPVTNNVDFGQYYATNINKLQASTAGMSLADGNDSAVANVHNARLSLQADLDGGGQDATNMADVVATGDVIAGIPQQVGTNITAATTDEGGLLIITNTATVTLTTSIESLVIWNVGTHVTTVDPGASSLILMDTDTSVGSATTADISSTSGQTNSAVNVIYNATLGKYLAFPSRGDWSRP